MGRDLSGVIRGQHLPASEAVILMNQSDGDVNNPEAVGYRGVRTLTHTYAVAVDGRWLLYDTSQIPTSRRTSSPTPRKSL